MFFFCRDNLALFCNFFCCHGDFNRITEYFLWHFLLSIDGIFLHITVLCYNGEVFSHSEDEVSFSVTLHQSLNLHLEKEWK